MLYTTLTNATPTEHSLEPKLVIECSFRLVLLRNFPLKEVTVPPVRGAPVRPKVGGGEEQGAGQDDYLAMLRHLQIF